MRDRTRDRHDGVIEMAEAFSRANGWALLVFDMDARPYRGIDHSSASGGDRVLGVFLCARTRNARPPIGFLLQRGDLYDDGLRRLGST